MQLKSMSNNNIISLLKSCPTSVLAMTTSFEYLAVSKRLPIAVPQMSSSQERLSRTPIPQTSTTQDTFL